MRATPWFTCVHKSTSLKYYAIVIISLSALYICFFVSRCREGFFPLVLLRPQSACVVTRTSRLLWVVWPIISILILLLDLLLSTRLYRNSSFVDNSEIELVCSAFWYFRRHKYFIITREYSLPSDVEINNTYICTSGIQCVFTYRYLKRKRINLFASVFYNISRISNHFWEFCFSI
jgi:hypothetical protein